LTLGPAWRIVQSQIGASRDAGDVLSGSSGKQILIGATTDGRKVIMSRYTQPEPEIQVLLKKLRLSLPEQPPPRVTANGEVTK
jgi:hypothetical protein